jgi:hypothetical protein
MPQLPPPPSKRLTAARSAKIEYLIEQLQTDARLAQVTTLNATFSERDICLQVQAVLDDGVKALFRPRVLRSVTWSQGSGNKPIPRVELGGHAYYPDHIIWRGDLSIAVEVKRYTGQSSVLQQVIGQSIIYAKRYGFVLAFIADVTREGMLARNLHAETQELNDYVLMQELYWYHNTFIVCRHVKEHLMQP